MAKNNRRSQRDTNVSTPDLSLDDSLLGPLSPLLDDASSPLNEVSDGRYWHPDPAHRANKLDGSYATKLELVDRPPTPLQKRYGYRPHNQTKAILAFADPQSVVHCIRRKTRKEVLFALKRTGGAGGKRRRHWHSNVRC